MNVFPFRALLVFTIVFVLLPSEAAQPLPVIFHNSRDGFTIGFPEGWTTIGAEKLNELNREAATQHPDWKRPAFHYGYRMTNAPGFLFPPNMVIRVSDKALTPTAAAAELEKDKPPQGVKADNPTFNAASNIISMHCFVDIENAPPVEGSIVWFLTRQSVIKMNFYVAQTDHDRFANHLQQIIDNIEISDKYEPPQPPPRYGLAMALIAIVAVRVVLYSAKPAAPKSNPATGS